MIFFDQSETIEFEHPNFNPTEFKRIISNLINNAVEAIEGNGEVTINIIGAAGSQLALQIQAKAYQHTSYQSSCNKVPRLANQMATAWDCITQKKP